VLEKIRERIRSYAPASIPDNGMPRAAVLIPLYTKDGGLHVLLTKRTDLVEHHKGQISFPGGALDESDPGLDACALRETHEEIGIHPEDVTLFGRLDDMITVSNFVVTPYVGSVTRPAPYPFRPSAHEVAAILEVPIPHLLDERNVIAETRRIQGREVPVYSFRFGEHVIWGATARMLKQFLDLIRD
jgi:8-oxo-dGTP pyrophosphatase MutT (NUDIX family)